jgi:steroid delta-isomerase
MRNINSLTKKITVLAMALMVLITASATRADAAVPADLTSQQIEAAIEDAFAGLISFDAPRLLQHYADDAILEDPVGTTPMQGKTAIAAYLAAFPTLFNQLKLYSLDIKPGGQEAGVTWRIRFTTKTGKVFFLEGIGWFKFNEQGLIQHEKQFFDLAYFLDQLQD